MNPAPVDYRRTSSPQKVALLDICQKYNTDKPDLALRKAAKAGDISDVECLLLDYDASPDNKSSNGFTALDWALQDGKLSKEAFLLLYHMQSSDSAAKGLLESSHHLGVSDKNSLLAYALHRKNRADQTLLIETFQADIYVAREIFMNTAYEDESSECQFMKKDLELSAQKAARAAAETVLEAVLKIYRTAFCDLLMNDSLTRDIPEPTNLLSDLQASILAETVKDLPELNGIVRENIERRLAAEEEKLRGTMFRMYQPRNNNSVPKSIRKTLPEKKRTMEEDVLENTAQGFKR